MGTITHKIAETDAELDGHFAVRHAVFVEEQGLFEGTDRDAHDEEGIPIVSIDEESGAVVGAVRCYETEDGVWFGGRLAVLKGYRHHPAHIGSALCKLAEKTVIEQGARRFLAYIQVQNVPFFERLNWRSVGEPVDRCGEPHQMMEASLAGAKGATPRDRVEDKTVASM